VNRFSAFLLLACSTVCLAQTPPITSKGGVTPVKAQGSQDKATVKGDLSDLFRNARLKIKEGEPRPLDVVGDYAFASGIWIAEVPGNDLVVPEQVSISCNAPDKSCSVLRVRLIVNPRNIELEEPDETDFNIMSWDAHGLLATYGPDQVDKCHRSVLSMSFASGDVSLSDIPTHEKGCEMFVNTNTYHLHRGRYYVDTTPNNDGVKF
jgi:hypothetical protein